MGYQVETILTNGRLVTEVFGSKNYRFLDSIRDYEEYDLMLADYFEVSTGELSGIALMKNVIDGQTENLYSHLMLDKDKQKFATSTLGAVYGYLQRDVCLHYGKVITRDEGGWPMFPQYLSDFEARSRSYWKTPRSRDFPHIFFILVRELEDYKKLYFETIKEKFPSNVDIETDMRFVFDRAKEENLNIFFCNS